MEEKEDQQKDKYKADTPDFGRIIKETLSELEEKKGEGIEQIASTYKGNYRWDKTKLYVYKACRFIYAYSPIK